MKLSLKKIQALDCLLKESLSKNNISHTLQLVIKIDNELWTGDFVKYANSLIYWTNIANFYRTTNKKIYCDEYFDFYKSEIAVLFDYECFLELFSKSLKENNYFLLKHLVYMIDKLSIKEIELNPILYNPKKLSNINSDSSLQTLYLDENIEYDVVSIIKID